jgi:hypothetical protein
MFVQKIRGAETFRFPASIADQIRFSAFPKPLPEAYKKGRSLREQPVSWSILELAFYVLDHGVQEHSAKKDDKKPDAEMADLVAKLISRVE